MEDKNDILNNVNDNMKHIITFFEKIGFSCYSDDITKDYFYMNKWLNDIYQIDVQGDDNSITIRLIGKTVEYYKDYEKFNENEILKKISDLETYNY